jgi:luciferase family oxidoreductase group 1
VPFKLSAIDLQGNVHQSLRLAPLVERFGYERYWLAEHPPQPSPMLISALLAGLTQRIRVGTAGILLHFYSPFRTAMEFQLLDQAFSGRIDVGFGAGAAAHPEWNRALLEGRDLEDLARRYPDRATCFVKHLRNTRDSQDFDAHMAWPGVGPRPPQVWGLGTSFRGASLAARNGLRFAYSLFFPHSQDDPAAVEAYRREYVPHPSSPQPYVAIAVGGVCAESEAAARSQAATMAPGEIVGTVVGDPDTCVSRLAEIADRYQADEIVFADFCSGYEERVRCYELIAEAAGLAA